MCTDTLEYFPKYFVVRKETICMKCFHLYNPPKPYICIYVFVRNAHLFEATSRNW